MLRGDDVQLGRGGRQGAGDRWIVAWWAVFLMSGSALGWGCQADPVPGRYSCKPTDRDSCPSGWVCRPSSSQDLTYRCFPDDTPICGNGVVEEGEACDGLDLAGQTCQSQGFAGGPLRCSRDCRLNTKGCLDHFCGNNIVESPESCDGTDLSAATCESQGFGAGMVSCYRNCSVDYSACQPPPSCGNGLLDPGELCDGEPPSNDCRSLGFPGGVLACNDNCSLDTSGCLLSVCGNGKAEADLLDYEDCDGTDLRDMTCYDLGYPGGDLACGSDCSYDVSGCDVPAGCGNGVAEGMELCDGQDLGGVTCSDLGYSGGELACTAACGYDTSGCNQSGPVCGNGLLEEGEECDGVQWLYDSCRQMGYSGGVVSCNECCCSMDTSLCECPPGTIWTATGCRQGGSVVPLLGLGTGGQTTCLVLDSGTMYCSGDNSVGQLGTGSEDLVSVGWDLAVDADTSFTGEFDLAMNLVCALDTGKALWCWGSNDMGQLGDGMSHSCAQAPGMDCSALPINVPGLSSVQMVALSETHVCVGTDMGVWCWGDGQLGQLGAGDSILSASQPVQVVGLGPVISLDAGRDHTCAVDASGQPWCWGAGMHGQLGIGSYGGSHVPVQPVRPRGDVLALSVCTGTEFTCVLTDAKTVFCWGDNESGQVGDGTDDVDVVSPREVRREDSTALDQVAEVFCGAAFACALTAAGELWCWGDNGVGQLGRGQTGGFENTAARVQGDLLFDEVTLGDGVACAVSKTGELYCWGDNAMGAFGQSAPIQSSLPVQVSPPSN